ncbi:hypothetical protein [Actinopolyspora halophila]|uniref:hypothetical protein n=1 Tax=Actinopolyspora halophila TaxID=1850 RepID=UPI0003675396|nr:hypothetical protein [Actinopolyspora halophila]
MEALMWEARAAEGKLEELLGWAENALAELSEHGSCRDAAVYRGGQDRVVVLAHFDGAPEELTAPPGELLARPVHQWPFTRISGYEFRPDHAVGGQEPAS